MTIDQVASRLPTRRAVNAAFALHGMMAATFASRIPAVQERLGIGPGQLGLALFMFSVGCVTTMHAGAVLAQRAGQRTVLFGCLVLWAIALPASVLVPNFWMLCAVLYVAGVGSGSADVAVNALGVHAERRIGASVMSSMHGLWSVGGIIGATIGALAAQRGIDAALQFGVVSVLVVAAAGVCWPQWADPDSGRADPPPGLAWPQPRVLVIGVLAFAAVFAEGASNDWSAIFLRDVSGAGPGTAALGVVAVAVAMTVGRLRGDSIVRRWGPAWTVRAGGVIATLGVLTLLASSSASMAILGFGCIGLGVCTAVPLAFAAAGRIGGEHPGQPIAAVATLGYGAGMASPSVIGAIAAASSVQAAFAVVGILTVLLVALATRLRG